MPENEKIVVDFPDPSSDKNERKENIDNESMTKEDKIEIKSKLYNNDVDEKRRKKNSKTFIDFFKTIQRYLKIISLIFSIYLSLYFVYYLLGDYFKPKSSSFSFQYAKEFKYCHIIGKDEQMENCRKKILEYENWISKLTRARVEAIMDPSNTGYLLYGPPGTGKTLFVKALSYQIDLALRKKYLEKTKDQKFIRELKETNMFDKYIDDMPSRVRFFYITPSLIHDKYIGGSENNVKELFKYASKNNNDCRLTFIMFDEAETLFGNRSAGINNAAAAYGSSKSELLTKVSQADTIMNGTIVVAATNLINSIDKAFLRRFGNKLLFDLPNEELREHFISTLLKDANLDQKEIKVLTKCCENFSPSRIFTVLRSNKKYNLDGELSGIDLENIYQQFKEDRQKGNFY